MKKSKGFTLIELLAVIVILAIIALIATPMVLKYIETSRTGADENSFKAIERAAELYYTSNMLEGNSQKTIYFPDEENILGLKGTKPTDGMVSISSDGKIKVIATINGKTYMSEGAGLLGLNHYFNATGSITATDEEWEYEKINDTDVKLTKYIGYKYHFTNDLNDLNIVSEATYNVIRGNGVNDDEAMQLNAHLEAMFYNMSLPKAERITLEQFFTDNSIDTTNFDDTLKKEGNIFYNLVLDKLGNKYENGVNFDNNQEVDKFMEELTKLVQNNQNKIPIVAGAFGIGKEINYLTAFIFPARLKTSDGIYNVKEIQGHISDGSGCDQHAYSLFEDVSLYSSCTSNSASWTYYANYFDKIIVPEGIVDIGSFTFEFMDTKELSLPTTLTVLKPLTDFSGYTNPQSLSSLEKLVIPASVETVQFKAIQTNQSSLKSIVFEGAVDGTSKLKTIEANAFVLDTDLGEVTIYVPGSISTIYSNSFNSYYSQYSTTKMNIIIKKDDCSMHTLINGNNITFTCEA